MMREDPERFQGVTASLYAVSGTAAAVGRHNQPTSANSGVTSPRNYYYGDSGTGDKTARTPGSGASVSRRGGGGVYSPVVYENGGGGGAATYNSGEEEQARRTEMRRIQEKRERARKQMERQREQEKLERDRVQDNLIPDSKKAPQVGRNYK